MSPRDRSKIKKYEYSKLSDAPTATRLVELLPGTFEDEIQLRIVEINLSEWECGSRTLLSLRGIQATLPNGWTVKESIRGDYLFSRNGKKWQRVHPDKLVEKWKYMLPEEEDNSLYPGGHTSPGLQKGYNALSYTWGSVVGAEMALVLVEKRRLNQKDQIQAQRTITIWKNLAEALRYLRDEQRSMMVWVDAICINQSDEAEKAAQIKRMSRVYKNARQVVVFIGPPDSSSQLALSTLEHLGAQVTWTGREARTCSVEATEPIWHMRKTDLGYNEQIWDSILALLRRPWFSRLWIVQEVRLAGSRSIIQCGKASVPLFLFRRAIRCLSGKVWLPSSSLKYLVKDTARLLTNFGPLGLSSLLGIARKQICSDPRDKIFGVMSLLSDGLAAKIHAPYSLSAAELYKNTFIAHIRYTQRLELFGYCSQDARSISGPSWVPDLSLSAPVVAPCRSQFASGCSRAHICYKKPGILAVLGVSATIISEISTPLLIDDAMDAVDRIRSWQPTDLLTGDYPICNISKLQAHAITLRMNRLHERQPDIVVTQEDWLALNAHTGLWGNTSHVIPSEERVKYGKAISNCRGRMYIRTNDGHIGLAPLDTKSGDVVAVFLGCSGPVVLRPEGNERFSVIGRCFILGLDDAATLLGPLPEPWRVEEELTEGAREQSWMRHYFINSVTGERTLEDPRLAPLVCWKRLKTGLSEAHVCEYFENEETGQVMDSDPRLLPGPLLQRGAKLRYFSLI